jgi:hypothetical protein
MEGPSGFKANGIGTNENEIVQVKVQIQVRWRLMGNIRAALDIADGSTRKIAGKIAKIR